MSEQAASEQPPGGGAHSTLAGNMLDPRISADGQKGGAGVGGTSAERVREEGAEHLRGISSGETSGIGSGVTSGMGSGMATSGPTEGEPTAAEQHGGGIEYLKSATGMTSGTDSSMTSSGPTAGEPTAAEQEASGGSSAPQGSMFSKLTSFIPGYGSKTIPSSTTEGGVGTVNEGSDSLPVRGNADEMDPSGRMETGSTSDAPTDIRSATDTKFGSTQPTENIGANAPPLTDSNVETSTDRAAAGSGETAQEEAKADKPPKPADKGASSNDNPSAIPTAGGQRLGEKHWGQSKIVPEVPPRRESEAVNLAQKKGNISGARPGISSEDGQSNEHTRANTQANTGQPPGQLQSDPAGSGEQTEGTMGKIKSKIGMKH